MLHNIAKPTFVQHDVPTVIKTDTLCASTRIRSLSSHSSNTLVWRRTLPAQGADQTNKPLDQTHDHCRGLENTVFPDSKQRNTHEHSRSKKKKISLFHMLFPLGQVILVWKSSVGFQKSNKFKQSQATVFYTTLS